MDSEIKNVLIVDDETAIRKSLSKILEREGYATFEANNGNNAIKIINAQNIFLVISDLLMPSMDGFELLKSIKKENPLIEFIMITGHGSIEKAVESIKAGAYNFITKPFKRADFLPIVQKAFEKYSLSFENQHLKSQLAKIENEKYHFIGNSREAEDIRKLVSRIANAPSNVLITGESGTGKEVIARLIHYSSNKKNQPFVAVNCGAIPENLIESELFGHLKGSFTGAISDKKGLFAAAGNGTLFLDEISTLPVNLQVKLLRALEEHEIKPVGSNKSFPVKARIIAASNRDLEKEIEAQQFREDLYFRLNVLEIKIPPLRERISDISLLAAFFIGRINKELSKNVRGLSADVLHLLQNHHWPGNVRELENVIERAMIFCDDNTIKKHHLPAFLTAATLVSATTNLKDSIAEFERKHIRSILLLTDGDKKDAAKMLGMGVSSLYRKIVELGMEDQ